MKFFNSASKTLFLIVFIVLMSYSSNAQIRKTNIQPDEAVSIQKQDTRKYYNQQATVINKKIIDKDKFNNDSIQNLNPDKGAKGAASWNYSTQTGILGTTYSWIDCSGGTEISLGDDEIGNFNWPFNFNFYDDSYTTADELSVCSNGFIRLDGDASTSYTLARDYTLGSTSTELGQIIALATYDCSFADGTSHAYYLTTGSGANEILTIEFQNMEIDYNDGNYVDIQVSFYETSNKVVIKYGTDDITQTGADIGIHSGVDTYYDDWQDADNGTNNAWIEYTPPTCSAPTTQATALSLTPDFTSISGSFTAATGSPDGYLIVRSTDATLSDPADLPVDNTTYVTGNTIGDGTVVQSGSGLTFNATGLVGGTTYYFFIFSQNNQCSNGPLYLTTSPLTGNATTLTGITLPYCHNFDTQDGWTTSGTANIWERGDQTSAPNGHSDNSVYATKLNANYGTNNVDAYLDCPSISLSGTTNPRVSFWMDMNAESGYDGGTVQIKVNSGSWITINMGDPGYLQNAPNDTDVNGLANSEDGWSGSQPSSGDWQQVVIDLFSLTTAGLNTISASDNIQVRFWFGSDGSVNSYQGWLIDDFCVYDPNDQTSQIDPPTTQVAAGDISSLKVTSADAVDVFKFDVTDAGSGDGLATKVTNFEIQKSGGTADWTDHIAGAELWDGTTQITDLDVTITDTEITFAKSTGSFDVADGTSKEVTLKIWLNTANIVDNSTMIFEVPTASHGNIADPSGSEFADPFTVSTTSNTMTVRVVATQLLFTGQPSHTATSGVVLATQPVVKATDIYGNVDSDISSTVTLSNSGSLTTANNSMSFVNGVADFGTPNNFQFSLPVSPKYVTLGASAGALSNNIPSREIAVDISGCTLFFENFTTANTRDLPATAVHTWQYTEITTSPNDWGIYSNYLTIYKNNNAAQYNNGSDGEEIAYCTTPIDATNYKNLTIDFDWKCRGESGYDYGTVVWSTDGTNWSIAEPTEYVSQNSFTSATGVDLSVCDGQQFYIGFRWINDGSGGVNPPFAVDNIDIKGFPALDYNFSYRDDYFEQITGTVVTLDGQDGANFSLPAGFDFKYDGVAVTNLRANLNGWLEMGNAHTADPASANGLDNSTYIPFLAPLWDNLTSDGQTRIIYNVEGTASSRVFTVEWKDVLWGGERQNFQVKLYETSYVIEFWYGDMNNPTGGSASIGINNAGNCGTLNKLISVTPGTVPLASYTADNPNINSATNLTEGLVYIFNPLQMQEYLSWEAATTVVGQANFTASSTTVDNRTTPGAKASTVSSLGVLAIGSGTANRVMIWSSVPTANNTAADFVIGQPTFNASNSNTTQDGLYFVNCVAFTPDGSKLIVAEGNNKRVLIYDLEDGLPTGNGQAASVVIGADNFTTVGGGCSATRFEALTGLIVTPDGKLIITDPSNNRVLIFNSVPTTNGAAADVVIGQSNFTSNSSGSTADKLDVPWDCAFTPEGKLLVSDNGNNNRVLIFNSVPTTNGAAADLVIGNDIFGPKAASCTKSTLNKPSVTVSAEGKIAIADFNNRVILYDRIPSNNGAAADYVLGQPNFETDVAFNNGFNVSGSPSDKNMQSPYSICFDLNGRLFVNGDGMHRVMIFGETPTETADLEISIVSDEVDVCIYSDIEYTVEVTNLGGDDASSVVVNAQLPVGMTATSYKSSIGTYNQKSGYWMIPYIANGETVTLTFKGEVQPSLSGKNVTAYANIVASKQADSDFKNNGVNQIVAVRTYYAPTSTDIADQYINRNSHTIPVIPFTVDDQDNPSDFPGTYTCTSSNTTLVPLNYTTNLLFAGSEPNKTLDITPATDEYGYSDMSLILTDTHGCHKEYDFLVTVGNIWEGDDGTNPTDWTTAQNWSSGAVPTSTIEAIIPTLPIGGNFPSINENGDVCEDLIIEPRANVTLEDTYNFHVYGDFNIESDATGTGSFVDQNTAGFNQVTIDGDIFIERYITNDAWHYVSTPITGATNKVLTENVCGTNYNGNVLDYNEAFSTDYDGDGDIDWFDGWEWPWYYSHNTNPLVSTNGYGYYTYAGLCTNTIEFTGTSATLNTGTYTYNVTNQDDTYKPTGSNPHRGWNLIGNPYPSGLNAETFMTANSSVIDGTVYMWDENGMTGFDLEGADYASFNGLGATGAGAGSVVPDKYISCGQAFFVHRSLTDVGGTNITFNNSMREGENSYFFKDEEKIDFQKIKLSIHNENNEYNQIIIALKDDATDGLDSKYDGYKMQGNQNLSLYSKINDENFTIQAIAPLTDENRSKQVNIGLYAGIPGTYTFNLLIFENISDDTHVLLEDTYEGEFINLAKTNKYVFTVLNEGIIDDRFILHFNMNNAPTVVTAIDDIVALEDEELQVYIPDYYFEDIDEDDILSYKLEMANGNSIPNWISFDDEQLLITLTPENSNVGRQRYRIVASDGIGASVFSEFYIKVLNVNDAPYVADEIEDISIDSYNQLNFVISEKTFADIDFDDKLSYTATYINGKPLPSWLFFNAEQGLFSGFPTNEEVGNYNIRVTATDKAGASTYDDFVLTVNSTTGLTDMNSKVNIYPNPSNGQFVIYSKNTSFNIEIIDATGKVIYQQESVSNTSDIDLKTISSGIYTVKLTYENEIINKTITIQQ